MIFLIEYDRQSMRTLVFERFQNTERRNAQEHRLKIELDRNDQGVLLQREILLLEARDEEALRRTHPRYFEKLPEGLKSPSAAQR